MKTINRETERKLSFRADQRYHLLCMTFWNPSIVIPPQPQKPSLAGALATECTVEAVEPAEPEESSINVYHWGAWVGEIVPVPCSQTGPTAFRHPHVSSTSPSILSKAFSITFKLMSVSLSQFSQNIQQQFFSSSTWISWISMTSFKNTKHNKALILVGNNVQENKLKLHTCSSNVISIESSTCFMNLLIYMADLLFQFTAGPPAGKRRVW